MSDSIICERAFEFSSRVLKLGDRVWERSPGARHVARARDRHVAATAAQKPVHDPRRNRLGARGSQATSENDSCRDQDRETFLLTRRRILKLPVALCPLPFCPCPVLPSALSCTLDTVPF